MHGNSGRLHRGVTGIVLVLRAIFHVEALHIFKKQHDYFREDVIAHSPALATKPVPD